MKNNWLIEKERFTEIKLCLQFFDDVPEEIINFLKQADIKKDEIEYNSHLAGHIKQEFEYKNWPDILEKYLIYKIENNSVLKNHSSKVNILDKNLPYYLEKLWCNFQKKYEYNPFHYHSGIFSFIFFLKIPYEFETEMNYFPLSSFRKKGKGENTNSKLCFFGLDHFGKITDFSLSVDKSFENKMIIFPAELHHLVYPFYTSDDYRITVSGNIKLKT